MTGRPILVTGSHRSGTGWVARMISASRSTPVAYLWEPFSVLHRPGVCDARFPLWFPYVCAENEDTFRASIADMLALRYKPWAELRTVRTPKDAGRLARDWIQFSRHRRRNAVPLMKDPIAVLSAEWLCDTFDAEVIVLVRHPAAFAHSLQRRGLSHPFDHFLQQPLLMRDLLEPFEPEIREFSAEPKPLLDQAILLWRIIYSVAAGYRTRRPNWLFLRIEDIAADPLTVFGTVFTRCGVTLDESARKAIAEHSGASNPAEADSPTSVHRDSLASVVSWKNGLAQRAVDRVRSGVAGVSESFYSDEDW